MSLFHSLGNSYLVQLGCSVKCLCAPWNWEQYHWPYEHSKHSFERELAEERLCQLPAVEPKWHYETLCEQCQGGTSMNPFHHSRPGQSLKAEINIYEKLQKRTEFSEGSFALFIIRFNLHSGKLFTCKNVRTFSLLISSLVSINKLT